MIRGIERRKIFNDDKDRENFIEWLSILLPETKTQCYARPFLVKKRSRRNCRSNEKIAYITGRGRQKDRVRDLLFYWTMVELGMPMVDLARKFDITPAAVSYAVQRGEKMAKERGYQLET